jgi:hypothetical protein
LAQFVGAAFDPVQAGRAQSFAISLLLIPIKPYRQSWLHSVLITTDSGDDYEHDWIGII